eukprot:4384366-Heterocapsa_arctica.AAC.1
MIELLVDMTQLVKLPIVTATMTTTLLAASTCMAPTLVTILAEACSLELASSRSQLDAPLPRRGARAMLRTTNEEQKGWDAWSRERGIAFIRQQGQRSPEVPRAFLK